MGNILTVLVAVPIYLQVLTPVGAITADLANKCRNMAIKAHPWVPPGTRSTYAQAERDFFRECVAKNGQMQDGNAPPAPQPKSN
jgi:hypothetical protein